MKKMYCPVCYREISSTVNGIICRHGFKKDRWVLADDEQYIRVDGGPCKGSGRIGFATNLAKPIIEEIEKRGI